MQWTVNPAVSCNAFECLLCITAPFRMPIADCYLSSSSILWLGPTTFVICTSDRLIKPNDHQAGEPSEKKTIWGNCVFHNPPSSLSFLSLSSSSGFVMGGCPSTLATSASCGALQLHVWTSSHGRQTLQPYSQTNRITKFLGYRKMEVNVGIQSWVYWSMHLAKYIQMKRTSRDVTHCIHVILTPHATYLFNYAMKRQYHLRV